jgi:hypothetical protein
MRDPESRMFPHARILSGRAMDRIHAVAVCGALLVIAAVLLGTLSYHPF